MMTTCAKFQSPCPASYGQTTRRSFPAPVDCCHRLYLCTTQSHLTPMSVRKLSKDVGHVNVYGPCDTPHSHTRTAVKNIYFATHCTILSTPYFTPAHYPLLPLVNINTQKYVLRNC